MNTRNAETIGTVHTHTHTHTLCLRDKRIGGQSGESCNLKDTVVLACVKGEISLPNGKLYIIYKQIKVDMQLIHRQTVF